MLDSIDRLKSLDQHDLSDSLYGRNNEISFYDDEFEIDDESDMHIPLEESKISDLDYDSSLDISLNCVPPPMIKRPT